jgi:hypothetical protein
VQPLPHDRKQAELATASASSRSTSLTRATRPPELFPKRKGWVVREDSAQRVLDVMQWGVPLKKGAKGQPTVLSR